MSPDDRRPADYTDPANVPGTPAQKMLDELRASRPTDKPERRPCPGCGKRRPYRYGMTSCPECGVRRPKEDA